jgi:Flp pilus assembly pilin Flp
MRPDISRWSSRRDRGASLVEYALVFGLVAILLVGAIDHLNSATHDELESRGEMAGATSDAIGDLSEGSVPTSVSTSTTVTGSPGDVVAAGVEPVAVTTTTGSGHKWNMSVLITVRDSTTGDPLGGAIVTGSFEGDSRSCTTDESGTCPLTRERIPNGTATMSFTLASVTYDNPSGGPPPAVTFPPESTVVASKP